MKDIKQAVILCGGLGTRLRPITNELPKPMVEINGKPFLWYLMDKLASPPNNINSFLLLTGYLQNKIIDFFGNGEKFGWQIKYGIGESKWDTGRRLWEAQNLIDHHFLLCYSDNFAQVKLDINYKVWKKNNSDITLVLANKKKGNVEIKDNKNNIAYYLDRKNNHNLVELGFMICKKESIFETYKKIKTSPEISFSLILEKLSKEKKISGSQCLDNYHSIGDIERLKKTIKYLKPKRILLLDRDGIINEKAETGKYITSWKDFKFIKDTINALRKLSKNGFKFIIISNQAGVSTGDVNLSELEEIHNKMVKYLKSEKINILEIFVSIDHWKSNNFRRKPNPGMFFEVADKYLLRLDNTFYIGDDKRDILAARNASCRSIFIGKKIENNEPSPDIQAENLSQVVNKIINHFSEMEAKY